VAGMNFETTHKKPLQNIKHNTENPRPVSMECWLL